MSAAEAIVIARSVDQEPIRKFVQEYYTGALRTEFHWISEECGTADALREIKDKIKASLLSF